MIKKLYYIENVGCDDTTCGLALMNGDEFQTFKRIVEDLNKNSRYGCMPVIYVYKVSMDDFKEIRCDEDTDMDYVYPLNGKTYTFAESYWSAHEKMECVIKGRE